MLGAFGFPPFLPLVLVVELVVVGLPVVVEVVVLVDVVCASRCASCGTA